MIIPCVPAQGAMVDSPGRVVGKALGMGLHQSPTREIRSFLALLLTGKALRAQHSSGRGKEYGWGKLPVGHPGLSLLPPLAPSEPTYERRFPTVVCRGHGRRHGYAMMPPRVSAPRREEGMPTMDLGDARAGGRMPWSDDQCTPGQSPPGTATKSRRIRDDWQRSRAMTTLSDVKRTILDSRRGHPRRSGQPMGIISLPFGEVRVFEFPVRKSTTQEGKAKVVLRSEPGAFPVAGLNAIWLMKRDKMPWSAKEVLG